MYTRWTVYLYAEVIKTEISNLINLLINCLTVAKTSEKYRDTRIVLRARVGETRPEGGIRIKSR